MACPLPPCPLPLKSFPPYTWAGFPSDRENEVQLGRNAVLRVAVAVLLLPLFALPVPGKSHKVTYPNACSEVWAAVKDTLGNAENYTIKITDESRMTVSYSVKHSAHVTVTGALRQRPNTVSLTSQGTGCEMEVQSNYSGFEHNDSGDFTKRVNESLAKRKEASPAEAAKPPDAK